ncbi:MAG: hypothetical protein HZB39_16685 [Planctomycetes bacterium]|nr:hypothetical protein [Planctomycetota bacterium]
MFLLRPAALCGAGVAVAMACAAAIRPSGSPQIEAAAASSTPTTGLRFVANEGAWDAAARFVVLGSAQPALVRDDGFALAIRGADGHGACVSFRAGDGAREVVGEDPLDAPVHVLRGATATSAASYGRVRLREAWPGVDVLLRADGSSGGRGVLAYDLVVRDVAALATVAIEVDGATALSSCDDGTLAFDVELGDGTHLTLVQAAPHTFARRGGVEVPLRSRAVVLGERSFGFAVDDVAPGESFCIDPGFVWSTYLGGGASDECRRVRRLSDGDLLVAGWAGSPDFPTTPGAFRSVGQRDAFVARMNGDGTALRWSTYLGGSELEEIDALEIAPDGGILLGGWTGSPDFPTTPGAYQRIYFGGGLLANIGDGFVCKLSADGANLLWSTYLGRVGDDFVRALAVSADGSIVVGGDTTADTFPTTPGVIQPDFRSGNVFLPDVFVSKLSADGSTLLWSTYLGGFAQDFLGGLAIAPGGSIVFAGLTASSALPVTAGAAQPVLRGFWDGFVLRMSADARVVEACTYLGGEGAEQIRALVIDGDGEVVAAGRSAVDPGATFPATPDAFQRRGGGEEDGFIARFSADLRTLRAATLIGGAGDDSCEGVTLMPGGGIAVVGWTAGQGFPIGGAAAQPDYGGGTRDGFVAQFDATLAVVLSISFAGGSARDGLVDVIHSGTGDELVAVGSTYSTDLPVGSTALQPTNRGDSDAIVLRIDARSDASRALVLEAPASPPVEATFAAGAQRDLLAFGARNGTGGTIELQAVECGIAGTGDALRDLLGISLFVDVDRDGRPSTGDERLAGPIAATSAAARVRIDCGRSIAVDESLPLLLVLESRTTARPGAEFTAWLESGLAIVARSFTDERRVFVAGPLPLAGAARISGLRRTFSGDQDGDRVADVRDVRSLAFRLGELPGDVGADPDEDGTIDRDDVAMALDRALGRAPLAPLPAMVDAGGLLVLRGFDLANLATTVELDGAPLVRLIANDRAHVFLVPRTAPRGIRSVSVSGDGRVRFATTIEVR